MKKITTLAAAALMLVACSKKDNQDIDEPITEETFKVSIQAGGFSQDVSPMSKRSSTVKNADGNSDVAPITHLELFIYDNHGRLVTKKTNHFLDNQYKLNPDADQFELVLPKGKYKIGLLGHNRLYGGLVYTFDEREMTGHSLRVDGAGFDFNRVFVRDAYIHRYSEFTVNSDTTFAPFELVRYTSRLDVKIEDEIPQEVDYIRIGGVLNSTVYPFSNDKNPIGREGYFVFATAQLAGQKDVVLSTPIYPNSAQPERETKLWISAYSADNILLKNVEISNLVLKSNHITTLTGKLFGEDYKSDANSGFKADIVKDYVVDEIDIVF